jgi:hypothetical protein
MKEIDFSPSMTWSGAIDAVRSRNRHRQPAALWSSSLDPMIHPGAKALMNSRAVIDACRPYEWKERFPEVAEISPELRKKCCKKFGRGFFGLR